MEAPQSSLRGRPPRRGMPVGTEEREGAPDKARPGRRPGRGTHVALAGGLAVALLLFSAGSAVFAGPPGGLPAGGASPTAPTVPAAGLSRAADAWPAAGPDALRWVDGGGPGGQRQIDDEFVGALIDAFRQGRKLDKGVVESILATSRERLRLLPNVMELELPATGPTAGAAPRLTVLGDTHGQFFDVLEVFSRNGLPSASNPYLFNGDIVDRGAFSVELMLTLLSIEIARPNSVFITRGNHESLGLNRRYGFYEETMAKYDEEVFRWFSEVFQALPLAAIIGGDVFVVHGGVAPDIRGVDDLNALQRFAEPRDRALMQLLWSDPMPGQGLAANRRGAGVQFGADETRRFLEKVGCSLLVRSHQVKRRGYEVHHDGRCITVFSAPNYCDDMGNLGAYIVFEGSLEPRIETFAAVAHPPARPYC